MQMTSLEILLDKYKQGILTGAEKQQLSEMILSPEHQQELEILIDNGFADPNLNELGDPETRELIYQQLRLQTETTASPSVIRKWWIGAAAAVFILFGTAVYLLFLNKPQKQIAVIPTQQERYKNDAPPGSNKAILTLGNGSTITLDSAQDGIIAQQGNSKVMKLAGGQLAYTSAGAGSANHEAGAGNHEVLYNMVSTPRGGQYKLSLPDGSVIWLNAASSIRYPTVFSGNERKVEIRGEAYFEVAKNAAKPFKVKILTASGSGGEVEVLGTHFNINAYDDEAVIRTTLLQGSVRVTMGSASTLLVPGEQVQVNFSGQLKLIKEADVDEAVAWMKGVFKFKQVTIGPLMRAIARWYDIDVTYEGKITNHFIVTIPRNITITNVFRILEQTGEVHFRIEGKKVTVMP
jgi:transmembrane sensor